MYEKGRDLAAAFVRRQVSRRELMQRASQLGLGAAATSFFVNQAMTQAHGRRLRLAEAQGHQTVKLLLEQASLCRRDDRRPRQLQVDDRHGRDVRHLPGGRLFRQGDGRAVLGSSAVRRLHDRRLHDLDLRPGRLDRRPQRVHPGPGQDQPELQLGRRAAGPARLDRLVRRAGRRARLGATPSSGHPLGLRAQLDLLQPARCSRRPA